MPDHFTDENEGEPVAELVQRLRGRADWYDDAHPGTVKTPQALREAASAIERLQRELDEARALLTRDHSLPHDWTLQQVIEGRLDDINKLKWQVRDTCIRAEAAEASLVKAREALKQIAEQDDVELALDPSWAKRIAAAALLRAKGGDNG